MFRFILTAIVSIHRDKDSIFTLFQFQNLKTRSRSLYSTLNLNGNIYFDLKIDELQIIDSDSMMQLAFQI